MRRNAMPKTAWARRGFTVVMALGLLALVAAGLLSLGALLTTDARRTMRGEDDAQLRQMLMAGATAARQHAGQWPAAVQAERLVVALPPELASAGGALDLQTEPDAAESRVAVRITARLIDRQMRQTLTFERTGGAWRPVDAALESSSSIRATTTGT